MIIKYSWYAVIAIFAITACKKDGNSTVNPPKTVLPTYPVVDTKADVYMVGTTEGAYPNNEALGTYWKNGIPTILADSLGSDWRANAIALNGTDIYIAGSTSIGVTTVATVWKNGKAMLYADAAQLSGATAIAVNAGNVYIAGFTTAVNGDVVAGYWKNGAPSMVAENTTYSTEANAIAVSGSDVYTAGFTFDYNNKYYQATYWKNGVATILSNNSNGSMAYGIAISGTDVYIAGYDNGATLWKNGTSVQLAGTTLSSQLTAVIVLGQDVYLSGEVNNVATYWKNGAANSLTFGSPGIPNNLANAIALNGSDVFVAGGYDTLNNNPLFWWNGEPVRVAGAQGVIKSIAVVPHP